MKNLNIAIIILAIIWVISTFSNPITEIFIAQKLSFQEFSIYKNSVVYLTYIKSTVEILINILIGCWLYFNAKVNSRPKTIWFLLGLIFGFFSIILFFIIPIYNELKNKKIQKINL